MSALLSCDGGVRPEHRFFDLRECQGPFTTIRRHLEHLDRHGVPRVPYRFVARLRVLVRLVGREPSSQAFVVDGPARPSVVACAHAHLARAVSRPPVRVTEAYGRVASFHDPSTGVMPNDAISVRCAPWANATRARGTGKPGVFTEHTAISSSWPPIHRQSPETGEDLNTSTASGLASGRIQPATQMPNSSSPATTLATRASTSS